MSYSLFIEGEEGARKVLRGQLPRRGDWINLHVAGELWWLPVVEVAHVLSEPKRMALAFAGCDWVHDRDEGIAFTSLAVGVRVQVGPDEGYKFVLPPSRWPLGGKAAPPMDARDELEGF